MKRFVSFLLVAIMVLTMIPVVSFAAETRTIYWDPVSGADTADGLTEATPVQSVEAAYAALDGADEGVLVLLNTLTLTSATTFPTCTIPVTITSKTGAEGITSGSNIFFSGDTTLDEMTLTLTTASNSVYLSSEGHDLTIGENVTTVTYTSGSTSYRFCLTTKHGAGSNNDATLTVKSGLWRNIFVGGYTKANTGNATLIMSGGNVNNLVGPTFSGTLTGNTTMHITGGTIAILMAGANQTGSVTGNTDIILSGGTITKVRLKRVINSKVIPIYGTATVTIDGDCSKVSKILHESSSGHIDKTVLVLKSGTLDITPCDFDEVRVEIPEGESLTLDGSSITADTVNSAGTLIFSGAAALTATAVTGSLSCDVSGDVAENHAYVTAPAGSSVTFPEATGVTEDNGVWQYATAFDTENFKGLVLKTTVSGISVKLFQNYNTTDDKLLTPVYTENTDDGGSTYYYEIKALNRYYLIAKPESGYARYNNHYNLYFTEEEAATKTVMDVTPNVRSTNGWDPSGQIRHRTDEVMDNVYPSDASLWPQYAEIFTTPAFQEGRNEHMQTTQTEMENFIAGLDDENDNMYTYILGQSAGKAFDIPLVIYTTVDLSGATTLEEAAALICADSEKNNKLTVHYQAQIHGNEQAAGEAALGMMLRLDGEYGEGLLDTMNIYVIPRLSPYGAYKSQRQVYLSSTTTTDPNRDFLRLRTAETQARMVAYNLFEPEVVLDGHEYQESITSTSHKRKDLMLCTHWMPNHSEQYKQTALDLAYAAFDQLTEDGLYYSWYTDSVGGMGANTGSSNTAFRSSLHILMETSGINQGLLQYERRVVTHNSAMTGIFAYLDENAETVRQTVHAQRQQYIENGKTYREDDIVVLDAGSSDHLELNIEGKMVNLYNGSLTDATYPAYVPDVIKRSRIAPTAYVIPAGESFTDTVLALMDKQGISYTYIPEGSALMLQQYTGTVEEADLTEDKLTYFSKGAYVFTMDQVDGYILANLMEPDVDDTASDKGTLVQQGIITATNGAFPIYRYCSDLNENDFVDYSIVEIPPVEITVFVDNTNGLDTNDGLTEATAVKTLEQAYALMDAALSDGGKGSNGTVIMVGLYDLGAQQSNLPSADYPVAIAGKTADDGFLFTGGSSQAERTFEIHGDTTFRNLTIKINNTETFNYIVGNGHKLTIGEDVTTITAKANAYFTLFGGDYDYTDSTASADLTVRSGSWRSIYAGGYRASVTGHVKAEISNCYVYHTIAPTYCGNIGSSEIKISNTTVESQSTSAIYCGPVSYNGTHKVGALKGESKLIIGDGVTAAAVYAGSRERGECKDLVTICINSESVTMPIHSHPHPDSTGAVSEVLVQLCKDVTGSLSLDSTVLDLNGFSITGDLTVDGTLSVKDSQTDDYTVADGVYGKITGTVTGALAAAEGYVAVEGQSFHKFSQYISGVSLRPGMAGIYYDAIWNCDEVLAESIDTFGVAVSLADLPGADFASDEDTLYTAFDSVVSGKLQTSVMIANILKGDPDDIDRAITDIYAASYVVLADGTVLITDNEIAYSLYDVVKLLDENYYAQYQDSLESFYKAWESLLSTWDLENIGK